MKLCNHWWVLGNTWLSEVHCKELSEGPDTDNVSQRAMAAHASLPLAVLVHNIRELGLAFAVAAQCGVVEGALNKSWWWSSITCSWAQKMHFISLDVCQVLVLMQELSLGSKWHLTFLWALTWLYIFLLPSLLWLISLQPPPPSQS